MASHSTSTDDAAPMVNGSDDVGVPNGVPNVSGLSIHSDTDDALKPTCNIITPVGMLGFGLHADHTDAALAAKISNGAPTAIVLDAGSTDGGPEKLALGKMTIPRESYARDLKKLITLVWKYKVPLIFSSAGGDGSDEHVEEMVDIVREVCDAEEHGQYRFKVISIFSGISKTLVSERLKKGLITGCGKSVPELTQAKINNTPRIVGQMGPEPMLEAMQANPDFNIVITGRAYDPAPYVAFAAFASKQSLDNTTSQQARYIWGGFTHMGKVLECGGICAAPKSNGAMGTVYQDGTFDLTPLDPQSKCTPISVAAHTLYEKSRPDVLYGPGGYLDLTNMKTEALEDGRSVRVRGGEFQFLKDEGLPYTLKLEGAEIVGYRSHMLGSFRDPILIRQLDSFLDRVKEYVAFQHEGQEDTWELDFHVYGQNQVSTLPINKGLPAEIFLIGEALASTQALATSVAATARIACTHGPYPGQKATSGNLAYGLGGRSYNELGPCAQFSVYHLMQLEVGEEQLKLHQRLPGLFKLKITEIKANNASGRDDPTSPSAQPVSKVKAESKVLEFAGTPQANEMNPETLGDISSLLRSKNSGPYEITLDVMFESQAVYQLVKESNFLTTASMANLFQIGEDDILWNGFFNQALAYKVTIPRLRNGKPTASGGYMENDVHASQQYIAFMNLSLPPGLIEGWNKLVEEQ